MKRSDIVSLLTAVAAAALPASTSGFSLSATPLKTSSARAKEDGSSATRLQMAAVGSVAKIAKAAAAVAVAGTGFVKFYLDKPSRTYGEGTVAEEYDAWTEEGILEYYWGEHIHLGYYNEQEKFKYKPLKDAQYAFIDEMMKFGGITTEAFAGKKDVKILDVGCGFGGTSRYLARALPDSQVTAITLSPKQVERATELAVEQDTPNVKFMVQDALAMGFDDNSFDVVWACESGEHMPDKKAYIEQMMRVLKPGGKFVMATWCQRDDSVVPFDKRDKRDLQYLYEEWTHPYFISKEDYVRLIDDTGLMSKVTVANWWRETIATWRHTIFKGIKDPRGFIFKPKKYVKCVRDAYCLERMHRAFKRGLMEYGMFAATKKE